MNYKPFSKQSAEEKLSVLKLMAIQMSYQKWSYFNRIKHGELSLSVFGSNDILEQMKATKSALKYTSKYARLSYKSAYNASLEDICKYTSLTRKELPQLPSTDEGYYYPDDPNKFDAVIIGYTPLKFLNTARKIREKSKATLRHCESLIARLYFKVAAYYAVDAMKKVLAARKLLEKEMNKEEGNADNG